MTVVKTLRFHFPVMDVAHDEDLLDLVTDVPGVVAALVDEENALLDVAVSSDACALLVKEEVMHALLLGTRSLAA